MNDQQSLGGISINITANSDKFGKEVSATERNIDSLTNKVSSASSKMSAAAIAAGNVIASAITKVTSLITSNIGYAVKRLDALNRFPIVMNNLGIATQEASNAIQALSNYTLGLPTTLNDAAEKVQYFTSATGNVWQSIKIFQALNDAIVSGAQTADVQSTAIYQWSQAIVRGSFDIEREFNAMVVANAKAVNEISEHLLGAGKDFNDLWEALKNGEKTMGDVVNAMVYLDENGTDSLENWATRARNSVAGIDTAITRLKTNIGKAVAVVAEEIGWKNIYTFVNNVGDAIYKAGQYVAAFVRILKEAFAWVSVLFGGSGSTSEIVKETSAAADNTSSLASGASDAADSLDDATSSAKKLNKQLASFDEMNVLTEKSSSGSDSSGSSAGSYDFDWSSSVVENATDKISTLVDTIREKFVQLFGEIDFSGLQQSLERFAKALKTALNGALKVGKRFITNFIQPLTKFAVEKALPRVFDAVSAAIEKIDFNALADAFGRLFSAAEGVGKIMLNIFADLVEMLSPLATWIANNLVPAFLDALSGALQLLGAIINNIWEVALKPLIQNFLIPLAQFTGGVVVTVLNAIGDALSWIAGNKTAVDVITALTAGITAGVVAYQAYQLVMGIVAGIQLAMNGAMVAGTAETGAYAVGLGIVSTAQSAYSTATSIATGLTSALSTAMSLLPFVAIAAAVAGLVGWLCSMNDAEEDSEKSASELHAEMDSLHQQIDKNCDGVISYTEALDGMADAQLAASNATVARIRAEETLASTTEEYQPIIDRLKNKTELTTAEQKELEKAEAMVENATIRLKAAIAEESEKQKEQTKLTAEATDAAIESRKYTVQQQLANNLASDSYADLGSALKDVISKNKTWTDSLGDTHEFTQRDINRLVTKVLASTEEMKNGVTYTFDTMTGQVTKVITATADNMERAGQDVDGGLANGISKYSYLVKNASNQLGAEALEAFKRKLGIQSPSKVMKEMGGFFSEGLAIGISDGTKDVLRAATDVANVALGAFEPLSDLAMDLPELGDSVIKITGGDMSNISELDEKDSMTQVVVKIGEETLVDRVVSMINDLSYQKNRAVVAV